MRVAVTGATGLIGRRVVAALRRRGDEVTALSRDPERALNTLERAGAPAVPDSGSLQAVAWDPAAKPAPAQALAGRDAIVHLAGEEIAQRWSASAKEKIRASRVQGTRNLVAGIAALPQSGRPRTLVSGSAIGYYGPHGDEPLDEETQPGLGFLAQTCVAWEAEANAATELGLRVVTVRTGVVLDRAGGALAKMLPPFKLGVGGPVAGGRQYVSWIEPADLAGIVLAALDDERFSGAMNATAPEPVRNAELAKALGRALRRPALLPVPGMALRALYGEMSEVVTTGARVVPAKALMNGYEFRYAQLDEALQAALGR
jgi:uncharacterized protein (TIGR01777 family)